MNDRFDSYDNNYYSFSQISSKKRLVNVQKFRYLSTSQVAKLARILKPLSLMNGVLFDRIRRANLNILDFGSGGGILSAFLRDLDYEGKVFSYDPYYSGDRTDVLTSLEGIDFSDVNLIYANQVLEHVHDPILALNDLYSRCHVGTECIISIPLAGGLLAAEGVNAFTLQVPDHINLFSLKGAMSVLSKTQWSVNSLITENLFLEYSRLSRSQRNCQDPELEMFKPYKYDGDNNLIITIVKNE